MYNNLIFLSNPVNGAQLLMQLTLWTFSVGSYGKRGLGEMRARGLTLATKLEIALEFLNKSFKNSLKGLVLYEKMTTFARLKTRQRA